MVLVATAFAPADAATTRPAPRQAWCHDPSTIVKEGDTFRFFATGRGVPNWSSQDLDTWKNEPKIFDAVHPWVSDVAPGNDGLYWAPDVVRVGDRWHVFYSVSAFGKQTSAIALVTTPVLDPDSPEHRWTDGGIVIQTQPGDPYNAIDPAAVFDEDGRLWMSFGSYWTGIYLLELDPATGLRLDADAAPIHLAGRAGGATDVEAPYIYHHDGWYYLFVNWGQCCRGTESTYNVRVGRCRDITGPYVDADGVSMIEGGGTPFAETVGDFIGPGHVGVLRGDDGSEQVSVHYYDGAHDGRPRLAIFPLNWSEDGWPMLGDPATSP